MSSTTVIGQDERKPSIYTLYCIISRQTEGRGRPRNRTHTIIGMAILPQARGYIFVATVKESKGRENMYLYCVVRTLRQCRERHLCLPVYRRKLKAAVGLKKTKQ